jgi:hypothetical protein
MCKQLLSAIYDLKPIYKHIMIERFLNGLSYREIEEKFREMASKDPAHFDVGKYRVMLMEMRKEFLEQMRKSNPKNEQNSCMVFNTITFSDPCCEFLKQLKVSDDSGVDEEDVYRRQKKIAISRYLLVKMIFPKRIVIWIRKNKLEFILGLIFLPIGLFQLLFLLFN